MTWKVRIEARSNISEVRAFLDGVAAALVAKREPNVVVSDTGNANEVEIEFALKTKHRAATLAEAVATIIEPHCASARVTLVCEVTDGGAS